MKDRLAEVVGRLAPCRADVAAHRLGAECEQALRTLVAGCGTVDLYALAATDRVTESCKQSLEQLLPDAGSYTSRAFLLGSATTPRGLELYVAASTAEGEPATGALAISLEIAGRVELVAADVTTLPARCDTPIFSASSVLDYSGSMSDRDVDDSIEIMRGLYAAIPDGCLESDVLLFSDDVRRVQRTTADRASLHRAVARNDSFPRGLTALVDAIGDGVTGVGQRAAPIRIALVATDGMENASQRYAYDRAIAAARAGNVRVISFGSLLSDAGFLERVGADTGGFFLYRPRASALVAASQAVGRMLAATRRVRIADPRAATATAVIVEHAGQRARYPMAR